MNYHTDEQIMDGVRRHYEYLKTHYSEQDIFGIFFQGSANYGADSENSDIDTWAIVMHGDNIRILNVPNTEEVIWVSELKMHLNGILASDTDYLTALFTKYYIINPLYEKELTSLRERAEEYAKANPYSIIQRAQERIRVYHTSFRDGLKKPHSKRLYMMMMYYITGLLCTNSEPYGTIYNSPYYSEQLQRAKTGGYTDEQAIKLCALIYRRVYRLKPPLSTVNIDLLQTQTEQNYQNIMKIYEENYGHLDKN